MVNFKEARAIALSRFSLEYTTVVLSRNAAKKVGLEWYEEVWEVETEVPGVDEELVTITMHLCFHFDFPLTIPVIYLSRSHYEQFKYIPHVNTQRLVCTFEEDTSSPNVEEPYRIVKSCFVRAKRIIEAGTKGENKSDIDEEFIAYWEESYSNDDTIEQSGLSLITGKGPSTHTVPLLVLTSPYSGYQYVFHDNNIEAQRLRSFLQENKIKYTESEAFFIGEVSEILPPFDFDNQRLQQFIEQRGSSLATEFALFVNATKSSRIVVFAKKLKEHYHLFGWQYKPIVMERKGFRKGVLSPFQVYTTYQKKVPVSRLVIENFTHERLLQRTAGFVSNQQRSKFLIAGVGSVGSNLLHFLKAMEPEELTLIDKDRLKLENIGRHYLGFSSINQLKTDGLKQYLQWLNPLSTIHTHHSSIIRFVTEKAHTLNEQDAIFVAIGKDNVEAFVASAIEEGIIKRPVFVFWVEPYLYGGHVIYIHPEDPVAFADLFSEGLFKYNVLDSSEYLKSGNQLMLKEGGCQSSYVPYSQAHILLFLSGVFPEIYQTIQAETKKSFSLSWIGDVNALSPLGLRISSFAQNHRCFQVIRI